MGDKVSFAAMLNSSAPAPQKAEGKVSFAAALNEPEPEKKRLLLRLPPLWS